MVNVKIPKFPSKHAGWKTVDFRLMCLELNTEKCLFFLKNELPNYPITNSRASLSKHLQLQSEIKETRLFLEKLIRYRNFFKV